MRFLLKQEISLRKESSTNHRVKDSKIKTSLIGEGGITEEFGKKKLKSFAAVDVSKTFESGGKFSLIGSKVLEPGTDISALGTKYTTPKGLFFGGGLSQGTFTETDPYEGKIVTKGSVKPKIFAGFKGEKGNVKISADPSLKSGRVSLSLNIGGKKKK